MPRFRIVLEYDGSAFVGWQRQDNGMAVQQVLEKAVYGLAGTEVPIHGAGRTDAGVHALAQVAHFDLDTTITANKLREAMNAHVRPWPVAIVRADEVDGDFHARFSAVNRSYRYRILNRRAPPALDYNRCWHVPVKLDVEAMHDAAQVLLGQHDFSAFRATVCQAKTPVKSIDEISVQKAADEIHLDVSARSFLHNQVRIIAGTLRKVGEGHWTRTYVENALISRDRTRTGPTAPAHGLYLVRVRYQAPEVDRQP